MLQWQRLALIAMLTKSVRSLIRVNEATSVTMAIARPSAGL